MTDTSLVHQAGILLGKLEDLSLEDMPSWKKKAIAEKIEECFVIIETNDRRKDGRRQNGQR